MSIEEILRKNRPNITDSSIKTYGTSLKGVYKKAFPDDGEVEIEKFNNVETFLSVLKNTPPSRRKSILAALVVLTNNDQYRQLMRSDSEIYEREINENKKSEKQQRNWVTQKEVKDKLTQMKKMAVPIIFSTRDILFSTNLKQ